MRPPRRSCSGSNDATTAACLVRGGHARRALGRAVRSTSGSSAAGGTIRGRVELRHVATAPERRPTVASLGTPTPLDATDYLQVRRLPRNGAALRLRSGSNPVMPSWISGTKRSSRICWPSRRARRWISRTATRSTTTCFRSRKPRRFDLGRYAAGHSQPVVFDRSGHRARVLRHPLAHERVHPRLQSSVLRRHRRGGPLPHRQHAAGQLQRDRVERRPVVGSQAESRCRTAARRRSTSPCDETPLLASEPHLPHERAARRALASASRSTSSTST